MQYYLIGLDSILITLCKISHCVKLSKVHYHSKNLCSSILILLWGPILYLVTYYIISSFGPAQPLFKKCKKCCLQLQGQVLSTSDQVFLHIVWKNYLNLLCLFDHLNGLLDCQVPRRGQHWSRMLQPRRSQPLGHPSEKSQKISRHFSEQYICIKKLHLLNNRGQIVVRVMVLVIQFYNCFLKMIIFLILLCKIYQYIVGTYFEI